MLFINGCVIVLCEKLHFGESLKSSDATFFFLQFLISLQHVFQSLTNNLKPNDYEP